MGGLFTSNTSVQDLLDQRNKRSTNLQQQLMQQASQGARDPAKAQAISMLGSTFGRALAGNVSGGDERMEKLKAEQEQQSNMQAQFGEVMGKGSPEQRLAFGQSLIQNNYAQEGSQIILQARKEIEDKEAADLKQREADIALAWDKEALETRATTVGEKLATSHPNTSKLLLSGDATAADVTAAVKLLDKKKTGVNGGVSTAVENQAAMTNRRKELDAALAAGHITEDQHRVRLATSRSLFGGGVDPRRKQVEMSNANSMTKVLTASSEANGNATVDIKRYQQSLAILDTGIYTGTSAEAIQTFRKFGILMGVVGENTIIDAAHIEQFRSNALESALKYVQQTSGAISEKEMALFQAAAQGLDKTPEANRLLINTAMRVAQWQKDRDLALNTWHSENATKNPSGSAAKVYMAKWEKTNELDLAGVITDLNASKSGGVVKSQVLLDDLTPEQKKEFNL